MSNFWESNIGAIDGSAEKAFVQDINQVLPNNTKVLAQIKSFKYINDKFFTGHRIIWKILDGEFKGVEIKHNIKTFDEDENRRFRALNMMRLLYKIFEIPVTSQSIPQDKDLIPFSGHISGIVVREFVREKGGTGNWISEIHSSKDFKQETGKYINVSSKPALSDHALSTAPNEFAPMDTQALEFNSGVKISQFDDEIPF